jgi:uncharacterized integral membrane protein (TIGR00697 family)
VTLFLIIFWILLISACTVAAAWYARTFARPDALIAFYVLFVITANLAAQKIVAYDLGFMTFFAPAATLIFAVTFLLTDIVNEKFGRAETLRMIWIAFTAQLIFLALSYMVLKATPAPFFTNQAAFETIFSNVPRVALASLVSFIISESLDAYIFQWFRDLTKGKQLWMRNVFSSIPSMAVDSVVFITLAFYGTTDIAPLIIGLIVIKWLVGIIDIPFMYFARFALGAEKIVRL